MLHIVLGILKILGILILVLLILLLILLAAILFVPIRYRVCLDRHLEIQMDAAVTWLFHFLHIKASYRDKKMKVSVRILGHTLIGDEKKSSLEPMTLEDVMEPEEEALQERIVQKHDKTKPPAEAKLHKEAEYTDPAKKWEEADFPDQTDEFDRSKPNPVGTDGVEKTDDSVSCSKKSGTQKKKRKLPFFQKLHGFFDGIRQKLLTIHTKIIAVRNNIDRYRKLWQADATRASISHIKKELKYLIRHILPDQLTGNLLFGFDDPAVTGQVLGVLCVLSGFTGNRFAAEADFEQKRMEGDVVCCGHVRICHFVKSALALLLDRQIWITIKRFRTMHRS